MRHIWLVLAFCLSSSIFADESLAQQAPRVIDVAQEYELCREDVRAQRYVQARERCAMVVVLLRAAVAEEHPMVITALGNAGVASMQLAQLSAQNRPMLWDAERDFQRALGAARRSLPACDETIIILLTNLQMVYYLMGDYGRSQERYREITQCRR